jgi:antagonist of KipI
MPLPEPARIRILEPGLLTTVQDLGRVGYQKFGVSPSGAMDGFALIVANRLVGNPDHAAGLEITVQGPKLQFETSAVIALMGADLSATVNQTPLSLWTSVQVRSGDRLSVGPRRSGARAYLAVAGGIDVPLVLGSRATDLRCRLGGLEGRNLAKGDLLQGGNLPSDVARHVGLVCPLSLRPALSPIPTLHLIAGPHTNEFAPDALTALCSAPYRLMPDSNRMGYRLEGPPLRHERGAAGISDAVTIGALQVLPDQQPVLLMADRQTTGGYPKIGVVISVDLPQAAQVMPGDHVQFATTTVDDAVVLARTRWAQLNAQLPPC